MAEFDFSIPDLTHLKEKYHDPEKYQLSDEIVSAVKAAVNLGQPLFITGEPGTGKTQLAYKVAHHFGLQNEAGQAAPLIFNTKTTSTARDLFYLYDAVRHFRDANLRDGPARPISDYIELQALGQAIALTNPSAAQQLGIQLSEPRSAVVLIDEIDKAPTDFPNDILFELENMAFEIKETGTVIRAGEGRRPIVIMTSNSEKSLPDAFLRRCVFLHIEFPGKDLLAEIVRSKLGEQSAYTDEAFIDHFMHVRDAVKKKKPATAELIGWLRMLEMDGFLADGPDFRQLSERQRRLLRFSYSILAKNKDDLAILEREFL